MKSHYPLRPIWSAIGTPAVSAPPKSAPKPSAPALHHLHLHHSSPLSLLSHLLPAQRKEWLLFLNKLVQSQFMRRLRLKLKMLDLPLFAEQMLIAD
ncbi:hypothetical protein L2E82_29772 [Cichorium intybus]|uniref:Uncharacterized protein n=1 Tax=Cichorium intybus TaxID=13427 RepID=A0ACB9CYY1_CICIN|nr:hypothetical protein L2E82_29772 [Cichorium intybus]